ncbi:MAG: thiamine diphosphokinase [Provencibacterium sp.]|nr:thiamine diphosphokinase [Provencibacterium sp.]
MKKGLIVAAGKAVRPDLLRRLAEGCVHVAAVDGGYRHCRAAGLPPDSLWGDMDSLPPELVEEACASGVEVERIPREKDDTDTLYALRRLRQEGLTAVDIVCALGGRLDHLVANLQTLLYAARQGLSCRLVDDDSVAEALLPGIHRLKREGFPLFSLFSLGDCCEGVSIRGAKYPLSDYRMENSFPIGVSNAFLEETAEVSFRSGALLLIRCREGQGS